MKKNLLILALILGGTVSASGATVLRWEQSNNSAANKDILQISQWHYFWNLQDDDGTTRPNKDAGNVWAGAPGDGSTLQDSTGSVYNALSTAGNEKYSIVFAAKSVDFTLNQALNLYRFDVSGSTLPTNWTIDFGTNGSITTADHLNFGQSTTVITFRADLAEEDMDTVLSGGSATRTLLEGKGDYGIWNMGEKKKDVASASLDAAGLTNVGFVESADKIGDGQYGFLYLDTATSDSLQLVAKGLVPEPTTATLSLLALAGLALRRRRR